MTASAAARARRRARRGIKSPSRGGRREVREIKLAGAEMTSQVKWEQAESLAEGKLKAASASKARASINIA